MTTVSVMSYRQKQQENIDGGWAWVVLFAAFCTFAIISGLFYTFGIYFSIFLDEFGESRSATAWIGSLNGAFFQISGPIGSVIIVKLGCRCAVMLGGCICTFGYLLSALSCQIWHLFLSYGIVIAIGHNLVYSGVVVSLGQYFQKRHSLAMGLSMAGSGVGILILGPAIQHAIYEFGWRGSMILEAGLTFNYLVAGSLIFPFLDERMPSAQEVGLMGSQILAKPKEGNVVHVWDSTLFKDIKFWCLNLSSFFWVMGGLTVFVISKDFAVSRGLGDCYTLALVGLGIGDIVGRVLGGVMASCRQISVIFYYTLAMIACSVVILSHLAIHDIGILVVLSSLFGFSYGQQSVLLPLTPMILYGARKLAITFGFILFTAGFGTLIGPPVAGWIVDQTDTYDGAYSFACICNFMAAVCMFFVYLLDKHKRIEDQTKKPSTLLPQQIAEEAKLTIASEQPDKTMNGHLLLTNS